jgi:hypothetical protein
MLEKNLSVLRSRATPQAKLRTKGIEKESEQALGPRGMRDNESDCGKE